MSRGRWRLVLSVLAAAAIALPVLVPGGMGSPPPTYHPTDPAFAAFDQAMIDYMTARGIHAGTLAVSLYGDTLWTQGFGTMTRAGTEAVPDDALLRLASITKPITTAAIKRLQVEGQLALSDRAFCMPDQAPLPPYLRCHLTIAPPPGTTPDPRLGEITIQHLIDHEGGWDRALSGDPMFKALAIAQFLGVPSPPSQLDFARYMVGQPLDHPPGSVSAYSNFGYLLLGLIIEEVTGRDYVEFVKTEIFFDPLEGSPGHDVPRDIFLGRSLPAQRSPREPRYNCDGNWKGPNVFAPAQLVCWADGGFYLEAMEAHGGLIASAETVAWFFDHYWMNGDPRPEGYLATASPVPLRSPYSYAFYGSLDGTWTLARQHPNGLSYVALFNQRWDPSGLSYQEIRTKLDQAAAAYSGL